MGIASAIIAGVGALTAVGGAVASNQNAIKGRREQRKAQDQAVAQATSQGKKADAAQRAANQNEPDVTSLLTAEQTDRLKGRSSSLLTGSQGVTPDRLKLGRQSLLGS